MPIPRLGGIRLEVQKQRAIRVHDGAIKDASHAAAIGKDDVKGLFPPEMGFAPGPLEKLRGCRVVEKTPAGLLPLPASVY